MKISEVVDFLEKTLEHEGDIEVKSVTGFWVRDIPATGERIIVLSCGGGKSLNDLVREER